MDAPDQLNLASLAGLYGERMSTSLTFLMMLIGLVAQVSSLSISMGTLVAPMIFVSAAARYARLRI
ncbi:hypothetical protein PverR02_11875 [Pseudomonas veronii]|nr:hypothetical protein PverR02_11875 [Pseudomonas veronii]